jgi:hypothetical protein
LYASLPVPKSYCTAHMPHRYIRYPYFSRQVRKLPEGATVFRSFSKNRIDKITLRIQWISLAQSNCLLEDRLTKLRHANLVLFSQSEFSRDLI